MAKAYGLLLGPSEAEVADKRGELLRLRSQEEKTSEGWGGVEGEALQTLV